MMITKKVKKLVKDYRGEKRIRNRFMCRVQTARELLKFNPQPELSSEQKKEIDEYWSRYGIKIQDYAWFQYYYGVTGICDPRFIPNDIYVCIMLPYYNAADMYAAWKDKNYFDVFLPDVTFPKTVIKNISGKFVDAEGNDLNEHSAVIHSLMTAKDIPVIVKNSLDTGTGKSVKKYTIAAEADAESILKEWDGDNYIVQQAVEQHPVLASFNESSVNIMRITSWSHHGQVHVLSPCIRIGTEGQVTDVCIIDGVELVNSLGITPDGYFRSKIANQQGILTPIDIGEVKVPQWDEVTAMVKRGHKRLKHFDLVGWDMTVDKDGQVICIEYNIKRPGCTFYQYVNGPFFGEHTDEALAFLKDKKNQEKYIPKWMRV